MLSFATTLKGLHRPPTLRYCIALALRGHRRLGLSLDIIRFEETGTTTDRTMWRMRSSAAARRDLNDNTAS